MTPADAHDRDHAFAAVLAAGRAEHGRIYPLKRDVAAFADVLLGILFARLFRRTDQLVGIPVPAPIRYTDR